MYTFLIVLHVIISLALIFIILIQVSRGATGSSFLGGSSDSLLMGPAGDVFLKKVVVVLGILFVITSVSISVSVKQRGIKFPAALPANAQPSQPAGTAR
ncbi:MAG: preprotein translocase subunit SecG [Elusimicrobiota bacterium]|nr:preprotein translocase subunit SecG [Elusimicrobiota bacterium]